MLLCTRNCAKVNSSDLTTRVETLAPYYQFATPSYLHTTCLLSLAFKIYDLVNTVYGTGYVAAIRETDYMVLLTHWKLAQGQSPTLYLEEKAMR